MTIKKQLPIQAQMAHDKVYQETKVPYIDPDFTAAQDLKRRTIEANKKFKAYQEELKQIEEDFEPFIWE